MRGERYFRQVEKMKRNDLLQKVDVIICDAGSKDGTTDYNFLLESGPRALIVRKGTVNTDG